MRTPLAGLIALATLIILGACQQTREVQYMMEVTRVVTLEVTRVSVITATPSTGVSEPAATALAYATPTTPMTLTPTLPESTVVPATPTPTITPDPVPAPVAEDIIVSEQAFEGGRMFYLQPRGEIWVMIYDDPDGQTGVWSIYDDTWRDGMPETDPDIQPPQDLVQPIRGFGKLWRENDTIQDALGWALDTEYGHWTRYRYIFNGSVNSAGEFVQRAGQHILRSREGFEYIFEEADGTWRRVDPADEGDE
jgi:hypothetical protein